MLLFRIYTSEYLVKTLFEIRVYKSSKEIEFKPNELSVEKIYKVDSSKIRPDIITKQQTSELLIEPFVTNKISYDKLEKIKTLNISCITINLQLFLSKYGQLFTLEKLKEFVKNDLSSKEWIWLKSEKRKSITKTIVERINKRISNYTKLADWDGSKIKSISTDMEEIENIDKANRHLHLILFIDLLQRIKRNREINISRIKVDHILNPVLRYHLHNIVH